MIANYGYKDGSGEYYISIDTDKCIGCAAERACLAACPKSMFEIITDDYDDEVSSPSSCLVSVAPSPSRQPQRTAASAPSPVCLDSCIRT